MNHDVLDLFSAAAGGWSLGLHRAGFRTVAACEWIDWRRALYAENNPGVTLYADVRDLTAERLLADLGNVPGLVVGSPPCQDISSANTKGRGVEGERSGLYFEAIRIVGELQREGRERGTGGARWVAFENSPTLRTRGADAVIPALEALGYTCWAFVVGAQDVGANHERKRSWILGLDVAQLADAARLGRLARPRDRQGEHAGVDGRELGDGPDDGQAGHSEGDGRRQGIPGRRAGPAAGAEQSPRRDDVDPEGLRHEGGRAWRRRPEGDGSPSAAGGAGDAAHADEARPADGPMEPGIRPPEVADDGRGARWGDDGEGAGQVGLRAPDRGPAGRGGAGWSLDDLADHLRLDDGLSARLAGLRVGTGDGKGESAAALIVEAFGDAVVPQIPEAIGRAILRVERAFMEALG